ncbi:uncharacterized protein [Linepithema humile]|uniref:uncharacterized protein isoform X1 n=1 Tax=Linepithema humile TaxID=83485 RepID=UPI00351F4B87
MYVTFIPYLLGTILSVDNVEKWILGSEYMLQLTKVTVIHTETLTAEDLTAMVKCQPKISDGLICCIQNVTFLTTLKHENNTQSASLEKINTEQIFEINFNKYGVQSLAMELNSDIGFNIIKWVVEQFNVGINLKIKSEQNMTSDENVKAGLHINNSFTEIENVWKNTKCNTSYLITYKSYTEIDFNTSELALNEIPYSKVQENDFQFIVLPISYIGLNLTNPINQIFSIVRHRETCINQPRYLKLRKEVWGIREVTTYFNKIEVKDKAFKFLSYTHLEGRLLKGHLKESPMFEERVYLKLIEIKPASNRLYMTNDTFVFQFIDVYRNDSQK